MCCIAIIIFLFSLNFFFHFVLSIAYHCFPCMRYMCFDLNNKKQIMSFSFLYLFMHVTQWSPSYVIQLIFYFNAFDFIVMMGNKIVYLRSIIKYNILRILLEFFAHIWIIRSTLYVLFIFVLLVTITKIKQWSYQLCLFGLAQPCWLFVSDWHTPPGGFIVIWKVNVICNDCCLLPP